MLTESKEQAGEVAIFSRAIASGGEMLSPDVARFLIRVRFAQEDLDRMNELAAKARAGNLTLDEGEELDNYIRVGHLLSTLKSRARKTLNEFAPVR